MTLSKSGTKKGGTAAATQNTNDAVKNVYAYNEVSVKPEEDSVKVVAKKEPTPSELPLKDGGLDTDILAAGVIFAGVVIASIFIVLRGRFGKD
jgi:hypothetical protein